MYLPTSEIILDRDVPTSVYDAEILSYLFHKINAIHINPTHTNPSSGISPSDTPNYLFLSFPTPPLMTSKPRPHALHHDTSIENGKLYTNPELYQSDILYHMILVSC
ncbi:hypothetical protein AVEN_148204-1 [Araneus ventricosus]|uniref:Uncharacterized protein n=1 Tax=Araneus ventricosus TaxID=182803 RepID=A0A4Y2DC69_ARAVE|nr:hypothetical protein AVEN_148204-1 [Araneus ventricosus]